MRTELFPLRELNGELILDWRWWWGDRPSVDTLPSGGPFAHKWRVRRADDVPECVVCGLLDVPRRFLPGCPAYVDVSKLPDGPRLSTAHQATQAAAALRAIWAAEKAKTEADA